MNSQALTMMIVAEGIIAAITIYFFVRVLTMPKKKEPDSFTQN